MLTAGEVKRWNEYGEEPVCKNHRHAPEHIVRQWLRPWQYPDTQPENTPTIRLVAKDRNWVHIIRAKTFRVVNQTKMGNAQQGTIPSGPGFPNYQLVDGG